MIAFISLNHIANAQDFEWAKQLGGPSVEEVYSIAVDSSGNVLTTGIFKGTTDFDPGLGTFNLTSAGLKDIFVHTFKRSVSIALRYRWKV